MKTSSIENINSYKPRAVSKTSMKTAMYLAFVSVVAQSSYAAKNKTLKIISTQQPLEITQIPAKDDINKTVNKNIIGIVSSKQLASTELADKGAVIPRNKNIKQRIGVISPLDLERAKSPTSKRGRAHPASTLSTLVTAPSSPVKSTTSYLTPLPLLQKLKAASIGSALASISPATQVTEPVSTNTEEKVLATEANPILAVKETSIPALTETEAKELVTEPTVKSSTPAWLTKTVNWIKGKTYILSAVAAIGSIAWVIVKIVAACTGIPLP